MAKTITVNIEEGVDREFRKQASRRFGNRKGYLGKALMEAMNEWIEKRNTDIINESLRLLKEGVAMKKKWKFNREELYER